VDERRGTRQNAGLVRWTERLISAEIKLAGSRRRRKTGLDQAGDNGAHEQERGGGSDKRELLICEDAHGRAPSLSIGHNPVARRSLAGGSAIQFEAKAGKTVPSETAVHRAKPAEILGFGGLAILSQTPAPARV